MADPASTLIIDGECGFCLRAARWARCIDESALVVAYQEVDLAGFGLTQQRAQAQLHWSDGVARVEGGAAAVSAFLIAAGFPWRLAGSVLRLPGLRWLAKQTYRLIAKNRHRLPDGTVACAITSKVQALGHEPES